MSFASKSQAGQDLFAFVVLNGKRDGRFLDIGCSHPIRFNNTCALEQHLGWRGCLYDNDPDACSLCLQQRLSPAVCADVTLLDWHHELSSWIETKEPIDYLSLDVDAATLATLKNLPLADVRFRVITVEHDAYRFGPEPRWAMIKLLQHHGYDILCADVCDKGLPFEIWCVDPKLVDMTRAERFRRAEPTDWKEFFK